MFIAFIAIALELAVMAFGAKVVLACYKACCCRKKYYGGNRLGYDTSIVENAAPINKMEGQANYIVSEHAEFKEHHKREHNCFGFLKFIGYFTMALSFIALVCTGIAFSCFINDVKNLERDRNGPVEQYRYDLDKLRIYGNYGTSEYRTIATHNVIPIP